MIVNRVIVMNGLALGFGADGGGNVNEVGDDHFIFTRRRRCSYCSQPNQFYGGSIFSLQPGKTTKIKSERTT